MKGARLVQANEASLPLALEHLRAGEPLVFPTDTVYGLGAPYTDEGAVGRIYRIKGRPQNKPIALLLADARDMESIAKDIPGLAWKLADRLFPGPLTLVLSKSPAVPYWVTGGGETVAARVPDHAFARALIRLAGAPLATTSANLAGRPAPTTARDAWDQLGQAVSLVLDGGPCSGGVESTVVDLTAPSPRLLRRGPIPLETLETLCGGVLDVLE